MGIVALFDGTGKPTVKDGPGSDGPHVTGPCRCDACGHRWVGVAPVEVVHLECPKCKRDWGIFENAIEPDVAWRCNCGNRLFWLTPTGALCRGCGTRSNQWAE